MLHTLKGSPPSWSMYCTIWFLYILVKHFIHTTLFFNFNTSSTVDVFTNLEELSNIQLLIYHPPHKKRLVTLMVCNCWNTSATNIAFYKTVHLHFFSGLNTHSQSVISISGELLVYLHDLDSWFNSFLSLSSYHLSFQLYLHCHNLQFKFNSILARFYTVAIFLFNV